MARKKTERSMDFPAARKAALYVRVSTKYQVDKDSLPFQRKKLKEYCKMLDINKYEIFEDDGYSAKKTERPRFQDMMNHIRAGEFTHLIVWKVDRISRNLLDFSTMYKELKDHRVTFISMNEQFDTSTAIGEAMLKIILIFAECQQYTKSFLAVFDRWIHVGLCVLQSGQTPSYFGIAMLYFFIRSRAVSRSVFRLSVLRNCFIRFSSVSIPNEIMLFFSSRKLSFIDSIRSPFHVAGRSRGCDPYCPVSRPGSLIWKAFPIWIMSG